jgi:hypothetical protein
VIFQQVQWDAAAAREYARVPLSPGWSVERLGREVVAGKTDLFRVSVEGEPFIWCALYTSDGDLCLAGIAGRLPAKHDQEFTDFLRRIARACGCNRLRMETARRGVYRRAKSQGWNVAEMVMIQNV